METILIAGGAGFIGTNLSKRLLSEGYQVICVDNFLTSDKKNIEQFFNDPNYKFLEEDITNDSSKFKVQSSKLDFIFHLASPASPNKNSLRSYIAYPIETLLVNSMGTYNLLGLAKEHQSKFLYASTSEIYGDPSISPQPESYYGNVNPNGVRSVYDEAKRFGEAMTFAFLRKYNVNTRLVRIFNTYGPHMQKDDGRVISNLINQAITGKPLTIYGDGQQTRSFCYVDDMVDGLIRAMFVEHTKGEVINLGNPNERTVKETAQMIKQMTSSLSKVIFEPLPEDDPRRRCPDITKAKILLDWEPKISLEEGLKKTIEYFKSI